MPGHPCGPVRKAVRPREPIWRDEQPQSSTASEFAPADAGESGYDASKKRTGRKRHVQYFAVEQRSACCFNTGSVSFIADGLIANTCVICYNNVITRLSNECGPGQQFTAQRKVALVETLGDSRRNLRSAIVSAGTPEIRFRLGDHGFDRNTAVATNNAWGRSDILAIEASKSCRLGPTMEIVPQRHNRFGPSDDNVLGDCPGTIGRDLLKIVLASIRIEEARLASLL